MRTKNNSRVLIFVSLFGFIISVGLSYAIFLGLFEKWTELPKAPGRTIEIVGAEYGKVYIKSTGGYFGCDLYSKNAPPCWYKINWPIPLQKDPYLQECQNYWSFVLPPPGKVVDEEDTRVCLIEGWNREIYALTENGNLWVWSHGENALAGLFLISIGTCIGTVFFLLFAILFLFVKFGSQRKLKSGV